MARCALIYEARTLLNGNELDVVGFTYGVIGEKEFDGESHQTSNFRKVWIDDIRKNGDGFIFHTLNSVGDGGVQSEPA
ncbi:hypothetical protein [Pseudomonas sp. CAM1A]|uniref:hypothetical protein n=1 Tax=Pseudomonas sp. CAM1A TaxID=3231717 RepID=UPI0039C5E5A5